MQILPRLIAPLLAAGLALMPVAASALYFDPVCIDGGAVHQRVGQRQRRCRREKGDWHCERHSKKQFAHG